MTAVLETELVLQLYRRLEAKGRGSCARVAALLYERGVRTRKGRGPSRQAVHYVMKQTPEGRALLRRTAMRMGK